MALRSFVQGRYPSFAVPVAATLLLAAVTAPAGAAGVVGTGSPGSCTEAALAAAMNNGGSVTFSCGGAPHTIVLSSAKTVTTFIDPEEGDRVPADPTIIDGGSLITLDGNGVTHHFELPCDFLVCGTQSLTLRNLTLINGVNSNDQGSVHVDRGSLTVENCTFDNNQSTRSTFGRGGAIGGSFALDGNSLTVSNSTFTNNYAGPSSPGGAVWASMGSSTGNAATISGSHFENNFAPQSGGAVYISNGRVTISSTDFVDNSTGTSTGGALRVLPDDDSVTHALSNLSFTGNRSGTTANAGGGALHVSGTGVTVIVSDSNFTDNHASSDGGAILNGVSSTGLLRVQDSVLSGNSALSGFDPEATGSRGGAIESAANALQLLRVTIENNLSGNRGGGVEMGCSGCTPASDIQDSVIRGNSTNAGDGGGVNTSTAPIPITGTTIAGNEAAGSGGGVGGSVTLQDSVVRDNTAGGNGGGLGGNDITVIDSLISGNLANGDGGGIDASSTLVMSGSTVAWNQSLVEASGVNLGGGGVNADDATLSNSTISGNLALGNGGGLYLSGSSSLHNVTIFGNTSGVDRGGGLYQRSGDLVVANTLLAENAGNDCFRSAGTPLANGNNLDTDGSCIGVFGANFTTGAAHLGPLVDNGGPTPTHILLAGSSAIDAGDNAICAAAPVAALDQRGVARPIDAEDNGSVVCDIGAVELTTDETIDTDGDGIPDNYENANGLNPADPSDAGEDPDNDGLTNLEEFQAGTMIDDTDTDDDGIGDGIDRLPTTASNVCSGTDASFGNELVRSGTITQCAASGSIGVLPTVTVEAGGRAELFAPQVTFESGFSLPAGGELAVDPDPGL